MADAVPTPTVREPSLDISQVATKVNEVVQTGVRYVTYIKLVIQIVVFLISVALVVFGSLQWKNLLTIADALSNITIPPIELNKDQLEDLVDAVQNITIPAGALLDALNKSLH